MRVVVGPLPGVQPSLDPPTQLDTCVDRCQRDARRPLEQHLFLLPKRLVRNVIRYSDLVSTHDACNDTNHLCDCKSLTDARPRTARERQDWGKHVNPADALVGNY